jgi:diguanylate cyclase (GGDEF)-like protein
VVQERKPLVNGNPMAELGHLGDSGKFTLLRSALSVPLEGVTGVIGALTLYSTAKDAFTRDHLRVVMAISSRLGATIENTVKYRKAEDGAALDFLTQLPNARALFVRLQELVYECQSTQTRLLVMVGDLDGFKAINDRLGHMEGNRLLQAVAASLKRRCRDSDYVARMGGDEFAIIARGVDPQQVDAVAERFRGTAIEASREIYGYDAVSLSLGIATLGEDGIQPEELLAAADRRMYRDKLRNKQRGSSLVELALATGGALPQNAGQAALPARTS